MRIQIVIPCFNEERRLERRAFVDFVREEGARVGLVFVNDGSSDGTLAALESIRDQCPDRIRVIDVTPNQGKAEAVRRGVLAAIDQGAEYIGYWDADLATPLRSVPEFARVLADHPAVDVVIGARVLLLGRRIERKRVRHYLGRIFATAASVTLNLPLYDTQCGAKLLRVQPATRSVFQEPFGSRWIFDVELLARYLCHGGSVNGLYEQPLATWADIGDSKVKPVDFLRAAGEMVSIYRKYPLRQPFRALLVPLTSVFSLYTVAGALGTVGHYITMISLVESVKVPPVTATVAGASVGALINYFANYHLTFVSHSKHRSTLPKFMLIAVLGMAVSGLGVQAAETVGIHYVAAQVACTLFVLLLGYALNRFWTFREERSPRPATEPTSKRSSSPASGTGR